MKMKGLGGEGGGVEMIMEEVKHRGSKIGDRKAELGINNDGGTVWNKSLLWVWRGDKNGLCYTLFGTKRGLEI